MGGVIGRLLHEFAVTIGAAVLVSGLVSLTLTPMLCSRFLRSPHGQVHGRLYQVSERFFAAMLAAYRWSLDTVLAHRGITMLVSGLVLFATGYLFVTIPKGFLPSEDTGRIIGFVEAPQDISFASMVEHQRAVAAIVARDPSVDAFMSSVGAGGSNTANTGRLIISLKPRSERRLSADQIIQELRPKLAVVPGVRVYLQNLPSIRVGGQVTKSQYQYTLQDADTAELYHWAPLLEAKLRALPGFQDVTTDLQVTGPQVMVEIDRDRASALGSPSTRSRTRSSTPTAPDRCPRSTRRPTSTGSSWSSCRSTSGIPPRFHSSTSGH